MTPTTSMQVEYWQQFNVVIRERSRVLSPVVAVPRNWIELHLGVYHAHLSPSMHTLKQWIGVQLVLERELGVSASPILRAEQEDIETEIGHPLIWHAPEGGLNKFQLRRPGTDPFDHELWREQHEWLLATSELFYQVFRPRLLRLHDSGDL